MVHVRQVRDQCSVVLEFSGALDVRSAEELVTIALQQPSALHLVIDMSGASNIHDSALGHLLDSLPRIRPHSLRGLGPRYTSVHALLREEPTEGIDECAHTD